MLITGQEWVVGVVFAAAVAYLAWRGVAMFKRRGGCGSCDENSPAARPLVQLDASAQTPKGAQGPVP
jgi:hypothetical protein